MIAKGEINDRNELDRLKEYEIGKQQEKRKKNNQVCIILHYIHLILKDILEKSKWKLLPYLWNITLEFISY